MFIYKKWNIFRHNKKLFTFKYIINFKFMLYTLCPLMFIIYLKCIYKYGLFNCKPTDYTKHIPEMVLKLNILTNSFVNIWNSKHHGIVHICQNETNWILFKWAHNVNCCCDADNSQWPKQFSKPHIIPKYQILQL